MTLRAHRMFVQLVDYSVNQQLQNEQIATEKQTVTTDSHAVERWYNKINEWFEKAFQKIREVLENQVENANIKYTRVQLNLDEREGRTFYSN